MAGIGLIALMVIGSLMLWVGIPIGWIWIGSKLQKGTQPQLGPYLVVLAGVIVSMIVMGKLLSRLNRAYGRLMGQESVRVRLPWHRSMRGERDTGHPRTILDVVMVASVSAALFAFGIWFMFFAHFSLPG